MLRIVILVSGGGTNLQAVIDAIEQGKIKEAEIIKVISNNKNAYALERARKSGIKACCISPGDYDTREKFNGKLLSAIEEAEAGLIVLAGFLVVLPSVITKKYKNRIINIHPSLIPSFCGKGYYGLKVHEAVLKRGVRITGATVHFVDEGTDTGPIFLQRAVKVKKGDTPKLLQKRVMEEAEHRLLPLAIDLIARGKVNVEDGIVYILEEEERS